MGAERQMHFYLERASGRKDDVVVFGDFRLPGGKDILDRSPGDARSPGRAATASATTRCTMVATAFLGRNE